MSTPSAKRRRKDAANHVLLKPFRSPFKRPLKSSDSSSLESSSTYISAEVGPSHNKFVPKTTLPKTSSVPNPVTNYRPRLNKNLTSPRSAALNQDPEVSALIRTQRELEKQLSEFKELLDTAEQAKKIEIESQIKGYGDEVDGELTELIIKWTQASRQAAEELFSKVQDRVNSMGGPRVWKEMEKRRREDFNKWNEESTDQLNRYNDDGETEGRDIYAEYSIDPETEVEKSQRANGITEFPGEEDVLHQFNLPSSITNKSNLSQDFTMAMMLTTMNIDLKTIGYDRNQQQWID